MFVLVALVPVLSIGALATGSVVNASNRLRASSEVGRLSREVRTLVTIESDLAIESYWARAQVSVRAAGLDEGLVTLLLGDELVLRVRAAMTSIDREYRRLGYEREADELHELRLTTASMVGPRDVGRAYAEATARVRSQIDTRLELLDVWAGASTTPTALSRSVRLVKATADLRAAAFALPEVSFAYRVPIDGTDSTLVSVASAYALYQHLVSIVDRSVGNDRGFDRSWDRFRADDDSAWLEAFVEATMATSAAAAPSDGVSLAGLSDLQVSADAFDRALKGASETLPVVDAAAGQLAARATIAGRLASGEQRHAVIAALTMLAAAISSLVLASRWMISASRSLAAAASEMRDGDLDVTAPARGPREMRIAARALNEAAAQLRLVERQAEALARGRLDDESLVQRAAGRLGTSLHGAVSRLAAVMVEREQLRRRLSHEATHDSLTGLANRAALITHLDDALVRVREHDRTLAVLMVDLDSFKAVNDLHGHAAGDVLLKAVAERLVASVRHGDRVGRLGGDEFVVVLNSVADADEALVIADRVRAAIARPVVIDDFEVRPGCSVGVALSGGDMSSFASSELNDLLRDADLALYRAKEDPELGVVLCDDQLRDEVNRLTVVESRLHDAIRDDHLELHYQQVVDGATGATLGVEALVRWRDGATLVPPDLFIPIAERSELILELDRWVLDAAVAQAARWANEPRLGHLTFAVNLSSRHVLARSLVGQIRSALARHRVDPSRLIIEVTESALLNDLEAAAETLGQLRAMGVCVAIDDFGTGYTSIAHLRGLPIDILKIDRSFVSNIDRFDDRTLIKLIVETGHLLGCVVIAEGVETPHQEAVLRSLGVDQIQGYLIGPPIPPSEMVIALARGALVAAEQLPTSGIAQGVGVSGR